MVTLGDELKRSSEQERLAKRLGAAERFIEGLREWQLGSDEQPFYQRLRDYDAAIAALEPSLLEVAKEAANALDEVAPGWTTLRGNLRAAIEREEEKQR